MICPNCGKEFELSAGQDKCPNCGAPITTAAPEGLKKLLWDNEGPFFTRLFNTWVEVMFHPTIFFKNMPVTKGIGKPLVYAIIVGTIGVVCGLIWHIIMQMFQTALFASLFPAIGLPLFAVGTVIYIMLLIFSPLLVIIRQFIWSGILHLCLMIFGGNKKGFEATFRAVSYGSYSPAVFAIIPLCGQVVWGIWSIVLVIIGLKEAHQIPTWKAILAYFLPLIFCCCCAFIICGLFFGIPGLCGAYS